MQTSYLRYSLVLIVIGVLLNYVVAWSSVLLWDDPHRRWLDTDEIIEQAPRLLSTTNGPISRRQISTSASLDALSGERWNRWNVDVVAVYSAIPTHRGGIYEWSVGWPCRSLVGRRKKMILADENASALEAALAPESDETDGAFAVPTDLLGYPIRSNTIKVLPVRPSPAGFVANSILYAGTILCLLLACRRIRVWRRVRLGQCPNCGHPIVAGRVCQECGRTL